MPPGGTVTATSPVAGLADAIDSILDKGLVIDAFVRVSVIGIDLLTVEARIVISSVDTYLRFADAVNRVSASSQTQGSVLESHRQARHLAEGPVGPMALGTLNGVPGIGTASPTS